MQGNSYQEPNPFFVNLEFKNKSEAKDLADELATWTPGGGWSKNAQDLFTILRGDKPER